MSDIIYKPCKTCGILISAETYVVRRSICVACKHIENKKRYQKAKDYNKAYQKKYKAENREKYIEYNRRERSEKPELVAARMKRYRQKHKDKIKEYAKVYRAENKDKGREYRTIYRELNRDAINEHRRKLRVVHKIDLPDTYIKRLFDGMFRGLPRDKITSEVIEAKRTQIKLDRLLKELE